MRRSTFAVLLVSLGLAAAVVLVGLDVIGSEPTPSPQALPGDVR